MNQKFIKAGPSIGQPGDLQETGSGRVLDQGPLSSGAASIQDKCDAGSAQTAGATCQGEATIQPKALPGNLPLVTTRMQASLIALKSGGQPLSKSTLNFFEPRFGRILSQVRVHTEPSAADAARSLNARAFTLGSEIAFAPGQYAPESADGRRLLAHELAHVAQQGGEQIRRQPAATPAPSGGNRKKRIEDAIAEGSPQLIAELSPADLAAASSDERMKMIDILLAGGSFAQKFRVAQLWDTFGKDIVATANSNPDRWQRSWAVAAGQMRQSSEVRGQETYFMTDVESVARGYLNENEQFCKDELARLGLNENGEAITGPPTQEQTKALASMQDLAPKIAAAQEAMHDLRKVKVGYEVVALPPGGTEPLELGTPTMFDPDKPPNFPPPESEPNRQTWDEVKKVYDDIDRLMNAYLEVEPGLYPLVRLAKEDPTKTRKVAGGTREQALSTIGAGLIETQENIAKTRPLLKTIAPDLEPIHGQLLSGKVAAGGRNWKAIPFYEAIGRDLVERRKPGPWWAELGLMAAQMGVYVIAGLATGGTALAIGLGVKGAVDVAMATARADAIEAAAKTNISAETALVTEGKVDDTKGELIMTAAFAIIDIAFAASAIRGALRTVRQFEQEAAKAAARASKAAEKAIAKHTADAAAVEEAKQAATEARDAAAKASTAAGTATEEEAARVADSSRRAANSAEAAERTANDLAAFASEAGEAGAASAKHPPPVVAGGHTFRVRGNWITRCSPPPCSEFAANIAERATRSANELAISGVPAARVGELRPRLNASATRARGLAARAEAELQGLAEGDAKRIAVEKRLQEEAALIELDVQAVEKQFIIEGVQTGELPKGWGQMVYDNALTRINTTWRRASEAGARRTPHQLEEALTGWRQRAAVLRDDARRIEAMAPGSAKNTAENGLILRTREMDKAIEGIEREERVRRDFLKVGEGGASLGESDKEIMGNLGTVGGPDFGRIKGDTLFLAESKGKEIASAIDQFQVAMDAPKLPPGIIHYDLRIYLKSDVWEELLRTGSAGGFSAKRVGESWYIMGLPKVRGNRVLLLPG
ncbi:MAG: DUF4157 domain-containing protein [Blastocatellia bacterium]